MLHVVTPLLQDWIVADGDWGIEGIVGDLAGDGVLIGGKPPSKLLALGLKRGIRFLAVLPFHRRVEVALSDVMSTRKTDPWLIKLGLEQMDGPLQ